MTAPDDAATAQADNESTADTTPRASCGNYCSYEAFGALFFEHAITPERIRSELTDMAGDRIDFGPRAVGPGGLVRIAADGEIGEATVAQAAGMPLEFRVTIPVDLQLRVRVAGKDSRFHAELTANLSLIARAAAPLRVVIDIAPPTAEDIRVDLRARGMGASLLRAVADVDGELRRYVAGYIGREIDKPHIRQLRDIDVADRIARAWSSG